MTNFVKHLIKCRQDGFNIRLAGLIKMAANRGVQVIAATQNAELISNFEPSSILTVDQRDGQSHIKRLDADELSQEAYRGYSWI